MVLLILVNLNYYSRQSFIDFLIIADLNPIYIILNTFSSRDILFKHKVYSSYIIIINKVYISFTIIIGKVNNKIEAFNEDQEYFNKYEFGVAISDFVIDKK